MGWQDKCCPQGGCICNTCDPEFGCPVCWEIRINGPSGTFPCLCDYPTTYLHSTTGSPCVWEGFLCDSPPFQACAPKYTTLTVVPVSSTSVEIRVDIQDVGLYVRTIPAGPGGVQNERIHCSTGRNITLDTADSSPVCSITSLTVRSIVVGQEQLCAIPSICPTCECCTEPPQTLPPVNLYAEFPSGSWINGSGNCNAGCAALNSVLECPLISPCKWRNCTKSCNGPLPGCENTSTQCQNLDFGPDITVILRDGSNTDNCEITVTTRMGGCSAIGVDPAGFDCTNPECGFDCQDGNSGYSMTYEDEVPDFNCDATFSFTLPLTVMSGEPCPGREAACDPAGGSVPTTINIRSDP